MYSSDNGATFGNKFTSTETSSQAPALAVAGGNLFIAWTGVGNNELNVACVDMAGNAITGFSDKVTLTETSPLNPALAANGATLYIGWKGNGNDSVNVAYITN